MGRLWGTKNFMNGRRANIVLRKILRIAACWVPNRAMWDFIKELSLGWWLVMAFSALIAVFFVVFLAVGCTEKQRVRDFEPLHGTDTQAPSAYFQVMNESARVTGYRFGGIFAQGRTGVYKCRMALWIAPDARTLVCIGGGRLAGMNYKKTSFISRMAAGNLLVTMDDAAPPDLSGTRDVQMVLNADFAELQARHLQRLATCGASLVPFAQSDLLSQYGQLEEQRVERVVALGFGRYLDSARNEWRLTFKGAWANAVNGLKAVNLAENQADRLRKKRPGG
jgi:hypothetical protein